MFTDELRDVDADEQEVDKEEENQLSVTFKHMTEVIKMACKLYDENIQNFDTIYEEEKCEEAAKRQSKITEFIQLIP